MVHDPPEYATVVPVLLPIPAPDPYSYAVPDGLTLQAGDIVQVPLGSRMVVGVVWQTSGDGVDPAKLRAVEKRFECPPLDAEMMAFIEWVADYTLTPPGMVLRMVLRAPGALDPPAPQQGFAWAGLEPERKTAARTRALELVRDGAPWTKSGLAHAAGVSPSVVDGLVKQGSLKPVELPIVDLVPRPNPDHRSVSLAAEQQKAADDLLDGMAGSGFLTTLLDGVTGAGKTEVYFEAVAQILREGRQVLILLPEIALTAAFMQRFENRFGTVPGEWHSQLPPARREKVWRQVAEGRIRVVAGARSALFLPFSELGLIVVDEEHDPAFKQEDGVVYHARDMAVVRGHVAGFPVILSSATPSIESRVNAMQGRYRHVRLDRRFADAAMPQTHVIDMRREGPPAGRFVAPRLERAIAQTVAKGEQALLFLNRRGYAPLTLCRACGHRFECSNCSAWLVEHRFRRQLQCHHCGHHEPVPDACPNCGALDHLAACGPGVERLAEEVGGLFAEARIIVLSSDMAGGVARLKLELEAIAKGEVDIVIGTQLVAKGHNFPLLSCVGVIDADLGLANGDPRAAERTFQLLSQVTGRAGRSGRASVAWLQSYQPEHPVIGALAGGDPAAFYEREIDARRQASLPPFGRLASVIVSATSRAEAERHASALRSAAPPATSISLLGPAEAPLAVIRGRHRFRLLAHGRRNDDMQAFLRAMTANGPKPRGNVRVQIDIDPQNFA